MYSALYGQDLNKAESISALFIGLQDKLARDGLTDTKSATGARRYTDWLKMVRKDVQAEFESAVSQIQHNPGAVGHAEKSFVIKMRGLIRQEDKLVRKSDINKLCHKAIEKVVEPMVSQKVLAAQRLNSERPGGFPPGFGNPFGRGSGPGPGGFGRGRGFPEPQLVGGTLYNRNGRSPLQCFVCGGNHFQRDCPQVLAGPAAPTFPPGLTPPNQPQPAPPGTEPVLPAAKGAGRGTGK